MEVRLHHVGVATHSIGSASEDLGRLGGLPVRDERAPGIVSRLFRFGSLTQGLAVELIQPSGDQAGAFLERFLDHEGEGPHHITFRVAYLEQCVQHLRKHGISPVEGNLVSATYSEAFIHPRDAMGVLIQLAQFEEVDDSLTDDPVGGEIAIKTTDVEHSRWFYESILGGNGGVDDVRSATRVRWGPSAIRLHGGSRLGIGRIAVRELSEGGRVAGAQFASLARLQPR